MDFNKRNELFVNNGNDLSRLILDEDIEEALSNFNNEKLMEYVLFNNNHINLMEFFRFVLIEIREKISDKKSINENIIVNLNKLINNDRNSLTTQMCRKRFYEYSHTCNFYDKDGVEYKIDPITGFKV